MRRCASWYLVFANTICCRKERLQKHDTSWHKISSLTFVRIAERLTVRLCRAMQMLHDIGKCHGKQSFNIPTMNVVEPAAQQHATPPATQLATMRGMPCMASSSAQCTPCRWCHTTHAAP